MSLDAMWRELRRRKVVRVVVAYAAVAFVVIQIGDIIFPALRLPDWTMTLVVVLAGLGFPVAVALAWAFDIGPSGIQRTSADPSTPRAQRTTLAIPLAAAFGLVALLAGAWALFGRNAPSDEELDPGLVAVIPFRVSSDASVAYLREGMVDLLAATLTGETGPRAADPRTTLSAWRRVVDSEEDDLTPEDAMRVARSIGAGHVLLGSVVGSASRLTVGARLIRLPDGEEGEEAREEGPADSLASLVDRVTAQLLSLDAGFTHNRLTNFTSASLPAVRAYLRGQSLFRRSRFTDARRAFDEALQMDSTFALAALGLRLTGGWGGASVPFSPRAAELAFRYRDRLAPADRAILEALVGTDLEQPRTVRERVDDWERTVTRYPDRPEAWFQYGDELVHRGPLADEPDLAQRVKAAFDRALQLDSSYTPALVHLMDEAVFTHRDTAEFRRLHAILARGDASRDVASYQYWVRIFTLGDTAGMRTLRAALDTAAVGDLFYAAFFPLWEVGTPADIERTVRILIERTRDDPRAETSAWVDAHHGLINLGRPGEARELLERAIANAADPRPWLQEAVLDALYADGDSTFAADAASRLERLLTAAGTAAASAPTRTHLCTVGQWRVWSGADVEAIVARLEADEADQPARAQDRVCADLLRTVRAMNTRSANAAARLAQLEAEASVGPPLPELFLRQVNASLARLHEAADDQAAALRAIRRFPITGQSHVRYTALLHERGRLGAINGERDAAIRAFTKWLRLRELAEPSLQPRIDWVRAELARLTAEG